MTTLTSEATTLEQLAEQVQMLVDEAEERRRLRQSISELTGDLSPITAQTVDSLTRRFALAEERGYFGFARAGAGVVDRVVTSFDEEDVEALGDNVVLILETIKEMTQPEIMEMMRSTFHSVGDVEVPEEPPSLFALARQMREPQVRVGLARLVVFLRGLGAVGPDGNQGKEAQR